MRRIMKNNAAEIIHIKYFKARLVWGQMWTGCPGAELFPSALHNTPLGAEWPVAVLNSHYFTSSKAVSKS